MTIEDNIDATNEYIATKWDQLNRNVDMFFTNKNTPPDKSNSSILFYSTFYKKEGMPIESKHSFQFKFDLPNTTKKLKIVIEKQQDEISNAISDQAVSNSKTINKDGKIINGVETSYTAGANLLLKQSKYFASFVNFGIKIDMPLNPFAKINLEKLIQTKLLDIVLSQKIIMYRQEGLQEISQLTFDKKWDKNVQTALINSLVWSDETDTLVLRNNFILTQSVGEEKGLTYSLGANAKFTPNFHYESYDASISYRQLVYKNWLYGTWTVGADFPKTNNFDAEKFVQFRVDILFKG